MRKLSILTLVVIFGLVMISAPAFAGPRCCSKSKAAKCAIMCKLTDAKAEKKANCKDAAFLIEGMEDKDCETEISKALAEQEGLICVVSIDHEDGKALLCYNPDKTGVEDLSKVIEDLGYEIKVMATMRGCRPGCDHNSPLCKKRCLIKADSE